MALFWRRVTLDEVLAAVRMELAARAPGEAISPELIEVARLLRDEGAGFVAGGPPPAVQEVVDGIPDAAGVLDSRGRLVVVNKALDELVGPGRALGRTLLEITRSGELGDAAEKAISGTRVHGEFTVVALDKVLLATISPISDRRAIAVLRDLTEQKRMEAVRRDFIANASHELRTPVAAISGAVETLLSSGQMLDASARQFVEMIARHAERLSRLTRELLDLSRLEAGDIRLELGPVELAPLCVAALDLVRARADEKRITLGFDGPPRLRAIGDRRALEQILVNLLDNAVKYTPDGGRVTVLADSNASSVVLSVLDTGPGIEPRHRARIFERFYRADPGRSREDGGTGLGLAIVKHLAQAQGGQVGVESGQGGSRFWVKLPAVTS
ncbi:MAG TPA: ATP-binding protein [Myxococcales bacterium]|nr:ATP-binding protein [Myxococcales bacterium]